MKVSLLYPLLYLIGTKTQEVGCSRQLRRRHTLERIPENTTSEDYSSEQQPTANDNSAAGHVTSVENGSNEMDQSEQLPDKSTVYYRVHLHFADVPFQVEFGKKGSPAFLEVSAALQESLEEFFGNLPGEQSVNIVQLSQLDVGTLATFDVGSLDNANNEATITDLLEDAIETGQIGTYAISKSGFIVKTVQPLTAPEQGIVSCPEHEFQCESGSACIPDSHRCNGVSDCSDASDESEVWGRCVSEPRIANVSADRRVNAGDAAQFSAIVEHLGTATIQWVKAPDMVLANGAAIVDENARLTVQYNSDGSHRYVLAIKDINPEDAGIYELRIDAKSRKLTRRYQLTVIENNDRKHESSTNNNDEATNQKKHPTADPQPPYHFQDTKPPSLSHDHHRCPLDTYTCYSGHCLPMHRKCDFYRDCPDGDDEKDCPPTTTLSGTEALCTRERHYRCSTGHCIDLIRYCDGHRDCPMGDDEGTHCACRSDQWRCDSGQCIGEWLRCNDAKDCDDGSDEIGCPTPSNTPSNSPSDKSYSVTSEASKLILCEEN